jgi:hypothetical protein
MFKSVTYEGFENAPELRTVCEGLTADLAATRAMPHKRIALRWVCGTPAGGPPTVEFTMTDDLADTDSVRLSESQLRDREETLYTLRQLRNDMLDRLMDRIIDGFELSRSTAGVS